MKKILLVTLIFIASVGIASAHSGRTDSSGGHNCRTGSCAGSYHYHNGGTSKYTPSYTTKSYSSYSNYGLSKADIEVIQGFLNSNLSTSLSVDGVYGNGTKSAVRRFQNKYNLYADGIVGSKTTAKIIETSNGSVVYKSSASNSSGSCDSNYSGCVPIASDVDCSGGSGNGPRYTKGPIRVIGYDIYGLDRDNDGIACE